MTEEIRQQILNVLREGCRCAYEGDLNGASQRRDRVDTVLKEFPEEKKLRGEWLLLNSFWERDAGALIPLYKEALALLGGPSQILPRDNSMIWGYFDAFANYYTQRGKADEAAKNVKEAARLYGQIGGTGQAVPILYDAGLARYRGEMAKAQKLADKGIVMSQIGGDYRLKLDAANILMQCAGVTGSNEKWEQAMKVIRSGCEGEYGDRQYQLMAELVRSDACLSLGLLDDVPEWICEGDFGAVADSYSPRNIFSGVLIGEKASYKNFGKAILIYMEYLLYSEQTTKALVIADMIENLYKVTDIITLTYLKFYQANMYFLLGDTEKERKYLNLGLEYVVADGLWLIAAQFWPLLKKAMMEELRNYGEEAVRRVELIGAHLWDRLGHLRNAMDEGNFQEKLTKREYDVALMAKRGMTNTEIALELGISARTVKYHLLNIFSKLAIDRRSKLHNALVPDEPSGRVAFWVK